ncbi:MAG: hypothetical protein JO086_12050 [Acidimicrobiia bacterium]|nr:hypothetical protein [Acidimicrobiia bacterium]
MERAWAVIYERLARAGISQPQVGCRLGEDDGAPALSVGWPDAKVGLAQHGDDVGAFSAAGWWVGVLDPGALEVLEALVRTVDGAAREVVVAESKASARLTTSRTEDVMVGAVVEAGLPIPDRNRAFRDEAGRVVTTPDLCWEEARLAVFVDGVWWHGGRDLHQDLAARAAADPQLAQRLEAEVRDTIERDAAKRRFVSAQGWSVMVVTDGDLKDGRLAEVTAEIVAAYRDRAAGAA